jgi:hypothetical protein
MTLRQGRPEKRWNVHARSEQASSLISHSIEKFENKNKTVAVI